jgi:hypothetical protein
MFSSYCQAFGRILLVFPVNDDITHALQGAVDIEKTGVQRGYTQPQVVGETEIRDDPYSGWGV